MFMFTIKEHSIYQCEIKKSKFITLLYPISNLEEIDNILKQVKMAYKDATHYCYAYKLKNIQKFSDDGEPGGTAGLPIIEVLNKKQIDYVLCIVIRYFGGIKLGAGGLVRAYSNSVKTAIDNNKLIELTDGFLIKIISSYDNQKQLDYLLKDYNIKKEYNENIIYYLEIEKKDLNILNNINYEIIQEIKIEKKKYK